MLHSRNHVSWVTMPCISLGLQNVQQLRDNPKTNGTRTLTAGHIIPHTSTQPPASFWVATSTYERLESIFAEWSRAEHKILSLGFVSAPPHPPNREHAGVMC